MDKSRKNSLADKKVWKNSLAAKVGKKETPKKQGEREVIYAEDSARICKGKESITSTQAKQLLGWEEETKEKFNSDFLIKDCYDKKIRCHNNITNRPLTALTVRTLKQEILRKKWHYNGETIIIGKTGLILNGQHQLIALVLATQDWTEKKEKWSEFWKSEPTIEKLISFGVDECDDVVNTMDTCKPRTLAEVIYRSKYFSGLSPKDLKPISRMTDYAIRFLWDRTGVSDNAFSVRRTHSESLDFINHHLKIIDCVKHIYEENGKTNAIGQFISAGYASGLLYMMGSSSTSPVKYQAEFNGSVLDWKMYSKASDFFVLLAAGAKEFLPIKSVLASMLIQNENVSVRERWTLLIKAWNLYANDKKITEDNLKLHYDVSKDGVRCLAETPTVGGIDCAGEIDPLPDEIEQRTAAIRTTKVPKKTESQKTSNTPTFKKGDLVQIDIGTSEPTKAKIILVKGHEARLKILPGYKKSGTVRTAKLADLKPV